MQFRMFELSSQMKTVLTAVVDLIQLVQTEQVGTAATDRKAGPVITANPSSNDPTMIPVLPHPKLCESLHEFRLEIHMIQARHCCQLTLQW